MIAGAGVAVLLLAGCTGTADVRAESGVSTSSSAMAVASTMTSPLSTSSSTVLPSPTTSAAGNRSSGSLAALPANKKVAVAEWPDACLLISTAEVKALVPTASTVTQEGDNLSRDDQSSPNDNCAFDVSLADGANAKFAVTLDRMDTTASAFDKWKKLRKEDVAASPQTAFDLTAELETPAYKDGPILFTKGGYYVVVGSMDERFRSGVGTGKAAVVSSPAFAVSKAIVARIPG